MRWRKYIVFGGVYDERVVAMSHPKSLTPGWYIPLGCVCRASSPSYIAAMNLSPTNASGYNAPRYIYSIT